MSHTTRLKHHLTALGAATFLLTGCGGAPTEGDIKKAFTQQLQNQAQAAERLGGHGAAEMFKSMMPEIKEIKKIGCKEDGEKAYVCDIEIEMKMGNETVKQAVPARMVKGSDGWLVQGN